MSGRSKDKPTWTKCDVLTNGGKPCETFAAESWGACWAHLWRDEALIAQLIGRLQARLSVLLEPDEDLETERTTTHV